MRKINWEMGDLTPKVGNSKFVDEVERLTGLRIEKRGLDRPRKGKGNEK